MKPFYLLVAFAFMSCNQKQDIDIQGHRGCRGLLPENSLPAFKKAIELGVHTLEMDLAISADKQVVVSHEPFMSRTICLDPEGNDIPEIDDKRYNLYQMTYQEIKLFDCGTKPHPRFPEQTLLKTYKPLLSEVFELAEGLNPNIKYNIEIKAQPDYDGVFTPAPKEFVELVLQVVNQYGVASRTNLQAFDTRILEEIKKQDPSMPIALLVDENESISGKLHQLSFKPEIISPYYELLTADLVTQYQQLDYKIIPWTVNDPEAISRMLEYGVDGIITDYPNRLSF
ncbi:MAG TPA: glycerophosphodiester phosphodiesterase [Flavobacteriaceae bacterium]|nr:glycerophosphodiester phosphodiesterase [Flavobacteriaceae bacterium]